jgi:hypothetical protein
MEKSGYTHPSIRVLAPSAAVSAFGILLFVACGNAMRETHMAGKDNSAEAALAVICVALITMPLAQASIHGMGFVIKGLDNVGLRIKHRIERAR